MKRILVATVLVAGLAVGGFAYAHGGGYGGNGMMGGGGGYSMMGDGNGMMGDGYGTYGGDGSYHHGDRSAGNAWNGEQSQRGQSRQFLDETVQLRKELNSKRFEYQEARMSSGADREHLSALEGEINGLQTELRDKAEQFR